MSVNKPRSMRQPVQRISLAQAGSRRRKDHCRDISCSGVGAVHKRCEVCGDDCCGYTVTVDPQTLRRRRVYAHMRCQGTERYHRLFPRTARTERTRLDYEQVTDALRTDLVVAEMTDQFPAESRAALRAFMESGEQRATIIGVAAQTLAAVIRSLGLDGEVFAETRGSTTVLRRIKAQRRAAR